MSARWAIAGCAAALAAPVTAALTAPATAGAAEKVKLETLRIPRTTVEFGRATGGLSKQSGLPDEGGTTADLATVGPITIRGLCRRTTNGDSKAPGEPFTSANHFDQDGDEAKVLIYTAYGNLAFQGKTGPRKNVPAGFGEPQNPTGANTTDPHPDDALTANGEGKHQILAIARDPEQAAPQIDWEAAFGAITSGVIATSGGTETILNVYAGIGVDGAGDKCVFGGTVIIVNVEPPPPPPPPGEPPGPGPPAESPPASSPAPAAPVTPSARPQVLTPAPKFSQVVTLPSAKRCVSRRAFRIRIRKVRGFTYRSATITLNGKRVRAVKGRRLTAPVVLRGLPAGRFTVKITVLTTTGQRITGTRKYRTCTKKRKSRRKIRV
jgi:hypothetical protein